MFVNTRVFMNEWAEYKHTSVALTHLPLVTHKWVSVSGKHWFR